MSNWEQGKSRSNYHFNKWNKDNNCVEHLGNFHGDWQQELEEVIDDCKPLTWANRRYGTGRPDGDAEAEEFDLLKAGADPKITLYRGLKNFTKCPSLQKMTDFFALRPVLQDWEPGQFLMYGNQQFDRWRAGDVHKFDWQNLPHATANASNLPRPMLVITGVKTHTTREILSNKFSKLV